MAKSDDFMLRILLAIIVLVVFMRTLSVKRAKEFKKTYNEVMHILSENVSHSSEEKSQDNEAQAMQRSGEVRTLQGSEKSSQDSKKEAQKSISDEKSSQKIHNKTSESSEKVSHDSEKNSHSSEEKSLLTLDDALKVNIIRHVKNRHYMLAKRLLEHAGYTNISIKRVRNMILIETDQGRTVLTIA